MCVPSIRPPFHYGLQVLTAQPPAKSSIGLRKGRLNCYVRSIYPSSISLRTTSFDCTT